MKANVQITGKANGSRTKYVLKSQIDGLSAALISADFVRRYREAIEATFHDVPKAKLPQPVRIVISISLP